MINKKDKDILRELGKQIAEIAALPRQQETIKLWKALNSLKPIRPMVLINQIPWHEMDVDGELELKTSDSFCQGIENMLRRTIYSWNHMRADMVVEPYITLPKAIFGVSETLGLKIVEECASSDPNNNIVSHHYVDQFQTEEDLEKIKVPDVWMDKEATAMTEEKSNEIFNGIIDVRMQGHFPRFTPWDRIVEWHGAENTLLDMIDRPEYMHKLMNRVTNAFLDRLDQLEEKGLLGYGQSIVKHSGAYTDELPASGFDPNKPRAKDIWSSGMAQIFTSASPAMFKEFELDYAIKWYERFGLVYYGCCEPLHDRIDYVSKIPNLRKISMSPWVDQEKGAEAIGSKFVYSRKPNPAMLANRNIDMDIIKKDFEQTARICERYGCPFEFILQDLSTVSYQPQKLWEWVDIAMKVVGA